jgi:hypothetical protein
LKDIYRQIPMFNQGPSTPFIRSFQALLHEIRAGANHPDEHGASWLLRTPDAWTLVLTESALFDMERRSAQRT